MREHVRSVRDLLVWQRAMDLVEICYRLTANFPQEEKFGLKSQIRRASTSISARLEFLNTSSVTSTLRQTEELARMLYRIRKTVLTNAGLKTNNRKSSVRNK